MPKETIVVGAEVSQLPNRVRRDELSVQFYETEDQGNLRWLISLILAGLTTVQA